MLAALATSRWSLSARVCASRLPPAFAIQLPQVAPAVAFGSRHHQLQTRFLRSTTRIFPPDPPVTSQTPADSSVETPTLRPSSPPFENNAPTVEISEPASPSPTPPHPLPPAPNSPPASPSPPPAAAKCSEKTAATSEEVPSPALEALARSKSALHSSITAASDRVSNDLLPRISDTLNELTGYAVVQECKRRVLAKDEALSAARDRSDEAKKAYERGIEERRLCQRELNSLLQRKDTWMDSDITRFTELYRKDLGFEQSETQAKLEYKNAAEDFDKCHREYLNEIRERYIEEQLYSDKIRRASTWWTWGLISLHFLLFLAVQLFVEPRKRRILKEELGLLITDTARADKSEWTETIGRELAPISAKLDAVAASGAPRVSPAVGWSGDNFAESGRAAADPQSRNSIYPKDRLFFKGVLCGVTLGLGSSILYVLSLSI
ncbi:sensitivity to high expression protein she9 [Geranomyces variabilis]|nr:sensitivity to high expression protein she9 [Geranomyces variabilis]